MIIRVGSICDMISLVAEKDLQVAPQASIFSLKVNLVA